jgi:hypothetical protein
VYRFSSDASGANFVAGEALKVGLVYSSGVLQSETMLPCDDLRPAEVVSAVNRFLGEMGGGQTAVILKNES